MLKQSEIPFLLHIVFRIFSANKLFFRKYGKGNEGPKNSINNAYMRALVALEDYQGKYVVFGFCFSLP